MLDTYEAEHESNLSRPMGAKNKPVQIPMTDNMIQKVDTMIDVAEKAILALEIAEFATLENQSEVKNYTVEIAEQFKLHHKDIDNEIQKLLLTHHSLYNHCLSKAMFVHSKPNSQDLWHVQIFSNPCGLLCSVPVLCILLSLYADFRYMGLSSVYNNNI